MHNLRTFKEKEMSKEMEKQVQLLGGEPGAWCEGWGVFQPAMAEESGKGKV